MRNIELKARLTNLAVARNIAHKLATKRLGMQTQVDTYFHANAGRLKLRQIEGGAAELVWYARPDDPNPKASDYQLVPIEQSEALKRALAAALGIVNVVRKRREIFLWHNVRIHLDEVDGLGHFLEFEAVLADDMTDAAGEAQLQELMCQFGIRPEDQVAGSYTDMIG